MKKKKNNIVIEEMQIRNNKIIIWPCHLYIYLSFLKKNYLLYYIYASKYAIKVCMEYGTYQKTQLDYINTRAWSID